MITTDDIKNLANLARVDLEEKEVESLTSEVDAILGYVSQIQEAGGDVVPRAPEQRNVLREDVVTNEPGEFSEKLLKAAPFAEGKYFKVKKIL